MSDYDLPTLPEECQSCPVYDRVRDYSDGLMVNKEEIGRLKKDVVILKRDVARHTRAISQLQESHTELESVLEGQKTIIERQEFMISSLQKESESKDKIFIAIVDALKEKGFKF